MLTAPPRDVMPGLAQRMGTVALGATAVAWAVLLSLLLRHRIFASHDAVNNYAHVWYVAGQIWHHHHLPWHMPILGHGAAYAFPYAFLAWLSAALVWPLFGDWTVTLWLALGVVGVMAAMFWALPELGRDRWLGAAALVNPVLVLAALFGQLPFLWATAFLFAAIGAWRRHHRVAATIFAALAQSGHPAVVLPITAAVVAARLVWEPDRRTLLAHWGASLVPVVPGAWLVLTSPVFRDSSTHTQWVEFERTVGVRLVVVLLPLALAAVARRDWRWVGPPAFAVALAGAVVVAGSLNIRSAWQPLLHRPEGVVAQFTASPVFVPGATYRLLRAHGERIGLYDVLRAGGRLDSEFFPESMAWHKFPSIAAYAAFLTHRHVDYVFDCADYDGRFATNEHLLLSQLARPAAAPNGPSLRTRLVTQMSSCALYAVLPPL